MRTICSRSVKTDGILTTFIVISGDMDIVLNNFDHATINVFVNNSSQVERDEELVKWFEEKYKFLIDNPKIEVLFNNTDFGVGD